MLLCLKLYKSAFYSGAENNSFVRFTQSGYVFTMIPTDSNPLIRNTAAKSLLMSYKYKYLEQLPERYHDEEEPKVPVNEPEHPEDAPIQVQNSAKWQLPEEVSLLGDTEFNEKVGMTKKLFKLNAW